VFLLLWSGNERRLVDTNSGGKQDHELNTSSERRIHNNVTRVLMKSINH
jgi:hypothetical protein